MNWIETKKQLPDIGEFVIVCDIEDKVTVGYLHGIKSGWILDGYDVDCLNITHWAKIELPIR